MKKRFAVNLDDTYWDDQEKLRKEFLLSNPWASLSDWHNFGGNSTTSWTNHLRLLPPPNYPVLKCTDDYKGDKVGDELVKLPTEEVKVEAKPTATKTQIGTKEFCDELTKIMKDGKPWRTPQALAEKLGVDPVDLAKWLDKQTEVCHRPGKEENAFYYALLCRLEKEEKKDEKKDVKIARPIITEEDRYCIALLHQTYSNLTTALEKYALRIHEKSEEAFNLIAKSKDRLSAGLALLCNASKADINKLPKLP